MRKCIIIGVICVCLLSSSVNATNEVAEHALADMTAEECLEILEENGLTVPEEFQNMEELEKFVQTIAAAVEDDSAYNLVFNYDGTQQFANAIKEAVNTYYGRETQSSSTGIMPLAVYELQDSVTVGAWDDNFLFYNCYAYALGYTYLPTNSNHFWPGDLSGGGFDISGTISEWADLTEEDLKAEGYSCVYKTKSYTNVMKYEDTHAIICLRQCKGADFHYMKLDDGLWYHKPGYTHVLQYLYAPYEKDWTNEYSEYGVAHEGAITYSGTIYYFAFRESHVWISSSCISNYHSGSTHYYQFQRTCSCGVSETYWEAMSCSGPPCLMAASLMCE